MSLVINMNNVSFIANYDLQGSTKSLNKITEPLSSGYKINHYLNDLSISETIRTQDDIRLLKVAGGSSTIGILTDLEAAIYQINVHGLTSEEGLENTCENNDVYQQNLKSAEFKIRDVDLGTIFSDLAKYQTR
jgi:flagellin-like hook-associated protein FlgL